MFMIVSEWETRGKYWDGGMWRVSESRARKFATRAEAETCLKGMTWADPTEKDLAKRSKPVNDVEIVEV